ncbi:MAG: hypothetical protein JWM80_4807 [Cyanobacteria bacterium RYN_339]|nr:hypothetical protein [Cyanobacteria bacterium RYN_339]
MTYARSKAFLPIALTLALGGCEVIDAGVLTPLPPASGAVTTTGKPAAPVIKPRGGAIGTPTGATVEARVLDLINRTRAVAGLTPVTYDARATKLCMAHANYLMLNANSPALAGFSAHKEDPSLPGYDPEWANLNLGNDVHFIEPLPAVDDWVASLYHRTQMLDANLVQIGFGYAGDRAKDNAAAVLAFKQGSGPEAEVAYPADGQTEVPLNFYGEFPNPIPAGHTGPVGYPLTLQEPSSAKMTGFKGSLTDDAGHDVPCYYSDKEHQASSLYDQGNVVCLLPQLPLDLATTYHVKVSGTLDGQSITRTWTFTSRPAPAAIEASDHAAVAAQAGQLATIEGKVRSGGKLDDGTIYFNFSADFDPSIFLKPEVWAQTGLGDPGALVGKRIRAIGPLVKGGSYATMDVPTAKWFTALK